MILQNNDFLLTDDELFELVKFLQPKKSRLAILPDQEPKTPTGVVRTFEQLPPEKRDELSFIIRGLASPVRIMRLHYSIADERISRQLIIWAGASDEIITLVRNMEVWRASLNSEFVLRSLIKETLAAGSSLQRDPFGQQISSLAVLVFLGIMEQMKYARLYSTLMSEVEEKSFTPVGIQGRMRQSIKEDFRWPLAIFEKVLPIKMMELISVEDVTQGLIELLGQDLIEASDEDRKVFELSEAGLMVADGLLHDVSKVAFCVTQCREDGEVGHDAVLMVRSAFYLFMFEINGEVGVMATLDEEGTDLFLKKTMEIPDDEIVSAAEISSREKDSAAQETWMEPGSRLEETSAARQPQPTQVSPPVRQPQPTQVPSAVRQPQSSRAIPAQKRYCRNCGSPVAIDAKFCGSCGKPI